MKPDKNVDLFSLHILTEELRQLTERVERVAPSLDASVAQPCAADFRAMLRARRLRDQFLPADLFGEPAWDMILDLMAAREAGQNISVSSLCIASAAPPSTALRYISRMTQRGLFKRSDDPDDGRRFFVELTDAAATMVEAWAKAAKIAGAGK